MIVTGLAIIGGIVVGIAALWAALEMADRAAWYFGYCRYYWTALTRTRRFPTAKMIATILRCSFIQCMQNYGYDMTTSCTHRETGETIEFHPPFKVTVHKKV